ncbi:hypothetical protein BUALT_Bualt02G0218700 [Buddleja alternifolia]|uniref:FAS1 domain-containing protein n=1 Tax=Buddleja alternifolia TaxID=168488 RepID=A0AAV6Y2A3_9LAMI|nr:hypothetical protein BUALT_Bualt02G0218700 [Buddleja alternifolia]
MTAATAAVLLSLTIIITSLFTSTAAASLSPSLPPSPNTSLIAAILSTLGFQDLAAAAAATNLSTITPTTIFAPTESSLLTCPSCSLPLLLQEHSVPGLYPLHFLRTLAFGTKIGTFANHRCLTVTASTSNPTATTRKVFINGVEITKPDLFNNGLLVVHSIQGFVSHLSPHSCTIETMTSLSFPQQPPPTAAFFKMRLMLKDAMMRLRISGYSVAALSMRVKYSDLSDFKTMTLFAIDDESIFMEDGGGPSYVAELGFHIVPNRLLMAAELMKMQIGTALPTMERGQRLVVTTAGGGGPMAPMRINYVKVKRFDMVNNNRIVVHGLSMPFRHVDHLGQNSENSRLGISSAVDHEFT